MLMQIDGTFIFVVISFIIFLLIIKAVLLNPISKVIDERNSFYAKNSKMETESKEKSRALLQDKEKALKNSRKEASEIIKKVTQEAKEQSAVKIKQAKEQTALLANENKAKLDELSKQAKIEAKNELNSIVQSMVSRVLCEEVSVNLSDEKINQYLNI